MTRFYLDENLPPVVAVVARRLGVDVLTVHDSGMLGASDAAQLRFAATVERVLVTRDVEDFVQVTWDCQQRGEPHAGVLIVTRAFDSRDYTALAQAMAVYAAAHPDGLPPYMVDYLRRPVR